MQESDKILFFKDDYEKFSNFYPCEINFDDRIYPSVEHAFVAAKTLDNMFRIKISLLKANEAGLAKRMGRRIVLRPDWDLKKFSIMKSLVTKKFYKDEFKDLLLSTSNKHIEEGNYWHDNYWGNCFCNKCKEIPGKNKLGIILMSVRDELQKNM